MCSYRAPLRLLRSAAIRPLVVSRCHAAFPPHESAARLPLREGERSGDFCALPVHSITSWPEAFGRIVGLFLMQGRAGAEVGSLAMASPNRQKSQVISVRVVRFVLGWPARWMLYSVLESRRAREVEDPGHYCWWGTASPSSCFWRRKLPDEVLHIVGEEDALWLSSHVYLG